MATADQETVVTYFANPFLRCDQSGCNRRAVGMVGAPTTPPGLGIGLGAVQVGVSMGAPSSGRNWPCYHVATRTSVCDLWTSSTGCPHPQEQRAQHSNLLTFEGTRR